MIGNLLSTVTKIVTLPVDIANSGMDMMCGGDGSKPSRNSYDSPLSMLEQLRDNVTDTLEDLDE